MNIYEKEEKRLITQMRKRQTFFDREIEEKRLTNYTCPCCGFPTLFGGNEMQACMICGWEVMDSIVPFEQITLVEKQISTEREVEKILKSDDLFIFEVLFNTYFDTETTRVTKEYLKGYVRETI